MGKKKHAKTQGFCTGQTPKPQFLQYFLVVKCSFHGFLLVHLPPEGASWAPPQRDPKMALFI